MNGELPQEITQWSKSFSVLPRTDSDERMRFTAMISGETRWISSINLLFRNNLHHIARWNGLSTSLQEGTIVWRYQLIGTIDWHIPKESVWLSNNHTPVEDRPGHSFRLIKTEGKNTLTTFLILYIWKNRSVLGKKTLFSTNNHGKV